MELFIPSVLVLLLAAAVIFFVLPRFGAPVLAFISVALLVYGIHQHMNAFGTEYRLSTWQLGLMSYAPYIMIGGLLLVMGFYLLSISSFGKPSGTTATNVNLPEMPSVNEMPPANTATNVLTEGVNNALKGITNTAGKVANVVGLGNATKNNAGANKGLVNQATNAVKNVANTLMNTTQNLGKTLTNTITGNNTKANNKGVKIPGYNFTFSQP